MEDDLFKMIRKLEPEELDIFAESLIILQDKIYKILRDKTRKFKGMRQCLKNALTQQLHGGNGHLIRLAIAWEMKLNGYTQEETVNAFKTQEDFDYRKTSYFVGRVYRDEKPKPFRCKTIRKLDFCDQSCSKQKGG